MRLRVKSVFSVLRTKGFIARMNFSCCMSCGLAEMEEILKKRGKEKWCFWHNQDDISMREGHNLMLRYGNIDPKESVAAGKEVCEELDRVGLAWNWNGSSEKCIEVLQESHEEEQ